MCECWQRSQRCWRLAAAGWQECGVIWGLCWKYCNYPRAGCNTAITTNQPSLYITHNQPSLTAPKQTIDNQNSQPNRNCYVMASAIRMFLLCSRLNSPIIKMDHMSTKLLIQLPLTNQINKWLKSNVHLRVNLLRYCNVRPPDVGWNCAVLEARNQRGNWPSVTPDQFSQNIQILSNPVTDVYNPNRISSLCKTTQLIKVNILLYHLSIHVTCFILPRE